jgi:DNA-binding XRE family transcriptional regulator
VAALTGVPTAALIGPSRSFAVIGPRAIALYLLRTHGGLTSDDARRLLWRSGHTVRSLTRRVRRTLALGGPTAALVRRIQEGLDCAPVQGVVPGSPVLLEPIFVRPAPERVLEVVAEVTEIPVGTLLGPSCAHAVSRGRNLAMYLLRCEAGCTVAEVGRLLGRGSAAVIKQARTVARDGRGTYRAHVDRARAMLGAGRQAAALRTRPASPRSLGGYLVGLAAARGAAGLNKKKLAERAGITRETVSRLESLRRPAEPATVRALAAALHVAPINLVRPPEACARSGLVTATLEVPSSRWRRPSSGLAARICTWCLAQG